MEFITQNGKSIKIIAASFKDAANLKKEAFKCLDSAGIVKDLNLNNLKNLDITTLFTAVSKLILNLDTSDGFETAVFDCLKVCIYDNKYSITPQLFDDKPELREDYYEIVSKCVEVNLRPFFKSLISELSIRFGQMDTEPQKSETQLRAN